MDILTETRSHNKENQHNDKEILKLRVELNDRIFELHKLEEDHAQQKAQIYIQLQKEKHHYNKTIKELRDKIKDDNQQWASKIEEVRAQKQESIAQLKYDTEQALQSKFNTQRKQLEERHSKEVAQLQTKLSQQIEKHRQKQEQLIRQSKANAQSITQAYLKQQQEKERLHKKTLNDLKQEYQSNITKMQNLFVNEEISRKKVENELQNNIISHIRDKIAWENTENTLKSQISKLNERIIHLQQSLHQLNNEKDKAQLAYKAQLSQIHFNFSTQMKQLAQQHNQIQRQNCYRYSSQITNLKEQIDRVIQVHKRKQQCWHQSGKMVLQLYQKRQSKKQDVKAIQKLQVQLIKKDFLIERQRKELQNCKLQLQNMEEVYDRIFIFNSNINRAKTKSYQIKKTKNSCQLNPSNRSTITDKRYPQK